MPEPEEMAAKFKYAGAQVDDAVEAWTGLYPAGGGYTNWGTLFTRYRMLARSGTLVALWQAYTGPTPVKKLWEDRSPSIRFRRSRGDKYVQALVGERKLWIRASDAERVRDWPISAQSAGS